MFEQSGYQIFPAMLDPGRLKTIGETLDATAASARQMLQLDWCAALAGEMRSALVAAGLIPSDFACVQCTYFEKSVGQNWLVPLHQDLSIPVKQRVDSAALGGWSEKDGAMFVQPPPEVLAQLVALRFHVDECGAGDGALRLVPGSHRLGRLRESDKGRLRDQLGEVIGVVAQGGGMAMSPLILHASSKATGGSRRRVLHFVFGPPVLPCGLEWPASTIRFS